MKNKYWIAFFPFVVLAFVVGCTQNNEQANQSQDEHDGPEILDDESIYQVPGNWRNQDNEPFQLTDLNGKIPVVSMIFTHCGYACPRIVADMKNIEDQVPKDKKNEVVFVLITFDTERDHPERLKSFAKEMALGDNWILLHGEDEEVRTISMLLDIKYKKQPNGDFAHSNSISLLDKKGVILSQVEGLGTNPQPLLNKLQTL